MMLQDTLQDSYGLISESFRRSLLAQNRSPRTVQIYTEAVEMLGRYLADKGMPRQPGGIRRGQLESFLADLLDKINPRTGKPMRPATAANRFRSLHAFF